MVLELKLRKIGNSVGVILPKEAMSHLKVEEGDSVSLVETQDGYRITQSQGDFAKTMAVMESLSKRYRNTLKELAK